MKKYILSLDQGTSSCRALIFDRDQNLYSVAQRELKQIYPQPGWVEQDPLEIFALQEGVMMEALAKAQINAKDIDSIGITNQRETTIVWERASGQPVYNAIVWQCRRTAKMCEELKAQGYQQWIREKTGLPIDAYFSATKIRWILDHIVDGQGRAERGELLFGTVDSWLIYKLSGGQAHLSDYTNASRTMLFNIYTLQWDPQILALFNIPLSMCPDVRESSSVFAATNIGGTWVNICGVAGDQQAALFGQTCFAPGETKNTYGTGCFLLMNTGMTAVVSQHGLLTTIANVREGQVEYALEGSVFMAGSIIQWLRDELHLIDSASESAACAKRVKNTDGVVLVPAFTGLGAPYWDMNAGGLLIGLTRGTNRDHIVRAGLEAIGFQVYDVLKAMEADCGFLLESLQVDGGASSNPFLMQFQADILGIEVCRPAIKETTALGAAFLAGLTTGFFESKMALKEQHDSLQRWNNTMSENVRKTLLKQWHKAIKRSKNWY